MKTYLGETSINSGDDSALRFWCAMVVSLLSFGTCDYLPHAHMKWAVDIFPSRRTGRGYTLLAAIRHHVKIH